MSQADAEQRPPCCGAGRDQLERDAGLVRRAWARRDQEAVGAAAQRAGGADGVVALDAHLGAELAKIVNEVPGEAVIIVDDEDAGCHLRSLLLAGLAAALAAERGLLDRRSEEAFAGGADRVVVALDPGRPLDRPRELLRHL